MNITFEREKMTKNTVRFKEVLTDELDTPKIGTIYVAKSTLKELGWDEGKKLTVELEVN